MQKIYISSWLGIDFKNLPTELSSKVLADSHFYEIFYEKFFSEVNSFDEINDTKYISKKQHILNHLFELTSDKKNILSIGCGLGYLEYELSKKNKFQKIVAIDPGTASLFLKDTDVLVLKGFFPEVLDSRHNPFDFVYAAGIDYAMTDIEYERFLKSVLDFGIQEIFIAELFEPHTTLYGRIKLIIKEILIFFGLLNVGQFWGYNRTLEDHKKILRKAGFNTITSGKFSGHTFWINTKV